MPSDHTHLLNYFIYSRKLYFITIHFKIMFIIINSMEIQKKQPGNLVVYQ